MKEFVRKNGVPSYIQVEEYLLQKILNREILPGDQLPTERELAAQLDVSRNTVSEAFKLLEKDGIVTSQQGRGTFVNKDLPLPVSSRKENLLEAVDNVIEKSLQLGFTLDQLLSFMSTKIYEYNLKGNKISIIVIDCNEEQAMFFTGYLQKFHFLEVHTILLEELPKLKDSSLVKSAGAIITTIKHHDEVKEQVKNKNILPVATTPNLESLVQIAHLAKGEKAGLVCSSRRFYEIFLETMDKAGVPTGNIILYNQKDNLGEFILKCENIIVTPLYEKAVRNHLSMGDVKNVIVFHYEIDKGSVKAINDMAAELKASQKKGHRNE